MSCIPVPTAALELLYLGTATGMLNDLRQTFIPRYYYIRITILKLIEMLKSENRNVLIKLIKFIKLAFNHRNSLISG